MEERYIASVDLGTSKLAVCVARVQDQNVEVIYYKESRFAWHTLQLCPDSRESQGRAEDCHKRGAAGPSESRSNR